MFTAQSRFDQRHGVVSQQRQAKGKQRRLGITQGIELTSQGCRNLKKCGLNAPALAVNLSQLSGPGPPIRYIGEDMELGVPVSGRDLELDRNAAQSHRL